jgi:hypothetical protein
MKPRNKHEKRIIEEMLPRLSKITDKQKAYGIDKALKKRGAISRNKLCCLECGHKWDSLPNEWQNQIAEINPKCPSCKAKLDLFTYNNTHYTDKGILTIIDRVKEFQVVRHIWIEKNYKKKEKSTSHAKEVVQKWIHIPTGKITTVARALNGMMGYRQESWNWGSDLSIKDDRHGMKYSMMYDVVYPYWRVHPEVKRNGLKKNFHNIYPEDLISKLLTDPFIETLMKVEQFNLLYKACYREYDRVKKFWPSIKICLRNNYEMSSDWLDHIELLEELGKDIHSPKYICPENFGLEHQRYIRKKRERDRKEKLDKLMKQISDNEPIYQMQKGHFFGVLFEDKDLKVTALQSVNDFLAESDMLGHCLFVNKYYERKNSLILSARIKGEVIETIEIDLSRMEVVQVRGRNNNETKYNSRIRKLVESNLHVIRDIHLKHAA